MIFKMKRIYLDVCCLNRPFDDQEQDRIHLNSGATFSIQATENDVSRARVLASLGFGAMDALHLACAERLHVDAFLTVDDKLIKTAKVHPDTLYIRVENPVIWVQEVAE